MIRSLIKARYEAIPDHDKHTWRVILKITWPAFIELVMSTLFGMVDMIMVGQIPDKQMSEAGLNAIGFTNQPLMLLFAIFAAVNVGTTTLVAWNIGAKQEEKAKSVVRQILLINLVLGTLLSVLGIALARYIVIFMSGNSGNIAPSDQQLRVTLGIEYFEIVAAGLVFQAISAGVTASLRGAGETKLPMLYNLGANLLNVLGNYVLIFGKLGIPEMGVIGAALSTTLSRLVACVFSLYVLFSRRSLTDMAIPLKGNWRPDFGIMKRVFNIGLPAALEQFILQGGLMLFARTVAKLGDAEFAAHQIGLNINGLTFSPSMAFGVAATTLVGQSLGANDEEKAERYADLVHHIAIGVACFVGLIFLVFSHPMARLYTNNENVARMAGTVLKIVALAQLGMPTQLTISGALRGAGDTVYPLYASAFGIWVFRVIVAHIFVHTFGWGLIGAWIALVLDQYTRAAIVFARYKTGKWKYMKSRTSEIKNVQTCS
ncbi:MAG TPA: MATE family efflux transporter [Candidatus Atribacteria bacterium]|nr:MATE family efflux transporter [Candidatus Atribacteria bacterium]